MDGHKLSSNKVSSKKKKHSSATEKNAPEWPRPVEVLSCLQQHDPSKDVQEVARQALLSLGAEGQSALQQVQLSSHGFQGIEVKEKMKE